MSETPTPSVSDAKVAENTGKSLQDWYQVLDEWGAKEKSHKEIAAYLYDEHSVSGWYAQSITVEYERDRGCVAWVRRAMGTGSSPTPGWSERSQRRYGKRFGL